MTASSQRWLPLMRFWWHTQHCIILSLPSCDAHCQACLACTVECAFHGAMCTAYDCLAKQIFGHHMGLAGDVSGSHSFRPCNNPCWHGEARSKLDDTLVCHLLQEAVAEAHRSLASDVVAQAVPSGSARAATASEVPLHEQLANIAQLCDAAREAWPLLQISTAS